MNTRYFKIFLHAIFGDITTLFLTGALATDVRRADAAPRQLNTQPTG